MNWDAIGAVGEIIGAVAVVVTLAYLAMQIRQNSELLRSQSRQTLVSNDVTSLSVNMENAPVFARFITGDDLSTEDQFRLSFMFALDLRTREFEYFQYKEGLLDEDTWLAYRHVILINHSAGLGRKWWQEIGRGIVDPEFARLVDEMLANAEPDDTYQRMGSWANS